jgi:hypothetical protein
MDLHIPSEHDGDVTASCLLEGTGSWDQSGDEGKLTAGHSILLNTLVHSGGMTRDTHDWIDVDDMQAEGLLPLS